MKAKLTKFEVIYCALALLCLLMSNDLHIATIKAQGTADIFVLHPVLFFLGAIAPITTMSSSLPVSGFIIGLFILVSPLLGAIAYKDFNQVRFASICFISTMLVTSSVVTGTLYSLTAGIGGLASLFVVGTLFVIAFISTIKEEIYKQLQPKQGRKT